MLKSILAASAVLATGSAAFAAPTYIGPSADISRGDAFAIRACGDAYQAFDSVCYNQTTTAVLSVLDVPVAPVTRTFERVHRVKCDVRFERGDESLRAQIANEFCPAVADGSLAPAPFLL